MNPIAPEPLKVRKPTQGPGVFNSSSPTSWNSLSTELQHPDLTLGAFKRQLKTVLFMSMNDSRSGHHARLCAFVNCACWNVLAYLIIIIIIITTTMFMVLSSWHSRCESSPGSFDECRLSAGWPPTLRPNQPIWAVSPPKDWLLPSTDTMF